MHEIIEYLYLGGLIDATNLDSLKRSNIDAIVCCCTPVELPVRIKITKIIRLDNRTDKSVFAIEMFWILEFI